MSAQFAEVSLLIFSIFTCPTLMMPIFRFSSLLQIFHFPPATLAFIGYFLRLRDFHYWLHIFTCY